LNILVAAAHPDDEVLGCGGTIARLTQEGHSVFLGIMGEGITSRYSTAGESVESAVESLRACSHHVANLLGIKEIAFHDLPDNRFDTVPLLDIAKIIEGLVARFTPSVIYTHHAGDLNVDHQLLHRAVLAATRPTTTSCVKELYAFEVPSSTEWTFGQLQPIFSPNFFVDISHTLTKKIEAMKLYGTEMRDFPHPRSDEALRALAQLRGSAAGLKAAEAFVVIRRVI
jgi:LmbE family N-acetylglucosaminyl deacetylase